MQQTEPRIKGLIEDIEHNSYELNAQMVQLDTVQSAVAQLMQSIEEIQHKGWDKDRGIACYAFGEIEQTVRLIDMAFYPLKKEMSETVSELNKTSSKAFELVMRENKKADAPTSTNEINCK